MSDTRTPPPALTSLLPNTRTPQLPSTGTPLPPPSRARLPRAARRSLAAVAALAALAAGACVLAAPPAAAEDRPRGNDVSSHQAAVDWPTAQADGAAFVYVKATEATRYRNPYFAGQYEGARAAGLFRGAYHFALPDRSSGAAQAAFFLEHGGAWQPDGRTLPPALDLEDDPYDPRLPCYGLSQEAMVAWIADFSGEVLRITGRRPVIYTTTNWWNTCTGGSSAFAADHALWIARHSAADTGALPPGWTSWTFWQYDDRGSLPGDQNLFNGSPDLLERLARGPVDPAAR
ncbi:GH25 family lysozyme [Streptomyces tropicalis]|uniref:GH25 family lysozyme n=1 Tax=Streptomyces tropicalis TaxID=3034234 RepID=A0ABT6AC09_9ACTN|nr:GH25 family lysozyme [Streptomyces tropicalis]MDF3302191.1 GH25 family lysozyme [Streptomyces tropicalis]